jgi:hypothetical protein
MQDPTSKITRAKWTGSVAQVYLLCKCKALSSNPCPTKKERNKQKNPRNQKPGKSSIINFHFQTYIVNKFEEKTG